jgi:hypothetical protein
MNEWIMWTPILNGSPRTITGCLLRVNVALATRPSNQIKINRQRVYENVTHWYWLSQQASG